MAHLTNVSFEFIYEIFTKDASQPILYHGAKKSKMTKNPNQGGSCFKNMPGWNFRAKNNFHEYMHTHTTRPVPCASASTMKFRMCTVLRFLPQVRKFIRISCVPLLWDVSSKVRSYRLPGGWNTRTNRLDFEK